MTDFDLSKITGTEQPLETEQDTMQEILAVLQSINNKMDSVETAATRSQQEVEDVEHDAFWRKRGARQGRGESDDEPEIVCTAPELLDDPNVRIGRKSPVLYHYNECSEARSWLDGPPENTFQEDSFTSVIPQIPTLDYRTYSALQAQEVRDRLDEASPIDAREPRTLPEEVQVTKVHDLSTGRSRDCQVPVAKGDRLVVNTDTLEVKVEEEESPVYSFVQWKRDADVWLGRSADQNPRHDLPNLGTLLARAKKMIAGLIKKEKKLRRSNEDLTEKLGVEQGYNLVEDEHSPPAKDQSSIQIIQDSELINEFGETHEGEKVGRVLGALLADWKTYKHWHEKTCELLGPDAGRTPSMIYATVETLSKKTDTVLPKFQVPMDKDLVDGGYYYVQYVSLGESEMDVGVWDAMSKFFRIPHPSIPTIISDSVRAAAPMTRPTVLTIDELDALTSEVSSCVDDSPSEEDKGGKLSSDIAIAQWKRDKDEFLARLRANPTEESAGVDLHATTLVNRASNLFTMQQRETRAMSALLKQWQDTQGLQDPSKFKPVNGDEFIIQYQECRFTRVDISSYDAEERWFSTNNGNYYLCDIEAMMPFPKPVKVNRSGK